MSHALPDTDGVSTADSSHFPIKSQHTLAINECPDFIAIAVSLIAYALTGFYL